MVAIPNYQLWSYHTRYNRFSQGRFHRIPAGRQRAIGTGIPHTVEVDAQPISFVFAGRPTTFNVRSPLTAPVGCDIDSGSSVTSYKWVCDVERNVRIRNLHKSRG